MPLLLKQRKALKPGSEVVSPSSLRRYSRLMKLVRGKPDSFAAGRYRWLLDELVDVTAGACQARAGPCSLLLLLGGARARPEALPAYERYLPYGTVLALIYRHHIPAYACRDASYCTPYGMQLRSMSARSIPNSNIPPPPPQQWNNALASSMTPVESSKRTYAPA